MSKRYNKELLEARDEYINCIRCELLGPGSEYSIPDEEHELITSPPESRYSIGILYPQDFLTNSETAENTTVGLEEVVFEQEVLPDKIDSEVAKSMKNIKPIKSLKDDNNLDEEVGLSAQSLPSSMGITFLAEGNSDIVCGKVKFATYRKSKLPDCKIKAEKDFVIPSELADIIENSEDKKFISLKKQIDYSIIDTLVEKYPFPDEEKQLYKNLLKKLYVQLEHGYVREPHVSSFTLDFSAKEYIDNNKEIDGTDAKITALRRKVTDNLCSVTIMLVNAKQGIRNGTNCLLQPEISIVTEENSFVFSDFQSHENFELLDEEEQSLELLYRTKRNYATGLGVSTDWEIDENGRGYIQTDFFPCAELPGMDFSLPENQLVAKEQLSMKYLSDLDKSSKDEKLFALENMLTLYSEWIEKLTEQSKTLASHYQHAAEINISECKKTYERMISGISTLYADEKAYNAFMLANRAMFMQRIHLAMQSKMSGKDRYPEDEDIAEFFNNLDYNKSPDEHYWRPFQIAFLLMDIDSIVNEKSYDRNLVDLIWFPTGGGKTEAYLGLTAFTIFYRRFAYPNESSGTAVMMRYTLRLLTAQQFTRASTLICACEVIREETEARKSLYPKYKLGKENINIGLWIGGEHTPNMNTGTKSAMFYLNELKRTNFKETRDKNNKFQVLKCPWCGTKMVKEYKGSTSLGEWGYHIRNSNSFYMCCTHDDCHFRAQLPVQIVDEELYNTPPTLLFATVDKFAMLPWNTLTGNFFALHSDDRPPELIIQDELHLISGPLGTVVGLYETAIDFLCKSKGVSPKIIASTATIRRAKEQCISLYNREVTQFPAPGIDAEDSFFARESIVNYEEGKYGRKYIGLLPAGKTKVMMEARALATLLQTGKSMDLPDFVRDKFWTLTAYFNSLKDLGKCSTLIDDDVPEIIKRLTHRHSGERRIIVGSDELTSRITTTQLNETLDKLEKVEYSQENIQQKRYASNILLATNMISVGIDIARLNVMLMVGQPKLTSEYIQASSRVGRSYPGVTFTLYDGSKSRDRSHYEQFKIYHDSFYKFVEPTGVTPFSKPARERALHAVIISILRHELALIGDNDASKFDIEYAENKILEMKEFILKRVEQISNYVEPDRESEATLIENEIDEVLEKWQDLVQESANNLFCFGRRYMFSAKPEGVNRLLKSFGTAQYEATSFNTLTSMRNVDSTVKGNVLIWESDYVE